MAINQSYLFLVFTLNGAIIGLLFDIFRILRKTFKTKNIVTYMEDILFWILAGISIIFFMYNFSNGNLRLFMVLGLMIGIVLYIITFSKIIINISLIIINILKQILKFFILPIKKISNTIVKSVNHLSSKIILLMTKIFKKDKVKLKNTKKNKK